MRKIAEGIMAVTIYRGRGRSWVAELYKEIPHPPEFVPEPVRVLKNLYKIEVTHELEHTTTVRGGSILPFENPRIEIVMGQPAYVYEVAPREIEITSIPFE